jgi:hypothetical protein
MEINHISLEGHTRSLHADYVDPPPAERNFCDNNLPMKPHILEWYNWHMDYVDSSDHMADSYLMSQHTSSGPQNCFPPSGSNSTQQLDTVIFMWD